ncbi:MAG: sodium-dependent transporter [Anaerovorax sp.]
MEKRGQWASNIGFILAAAGSAVGLGNIWKFPGVAYNNGGGAFIIMYIAIVFLIGATVMLTEFTVGRRTQKNAVGAFKALDKRFTWVGGLGILTGFIILCYYGHVGGWVIKYIVAYATQSSVIYADPSNFFLNFLGADGHFPVQAAIIFPLIFMILTVFIIMKGVAGGIEKVNKVLMPALFVILIVIAIRSLTLPGAMASLMDFLAVDFGKLNGASVLAGLGQAFFSLSLGMGVMVTYGSYLSKQENLVKNTFTVCSLDTMVALIAGLAIIPAVLISGVEVGMGGGFAFISLATVFQGMPFGAFFGMLFYVLLFFAALTSAISILEGTVAYVSEEMNFDRKKVTMVLGGVMFLIGMLYTLGQAYSGMKGIWFDASGVSYPGFGDFMEYLTDRLLMPICALAFCIFVGWFWGIDKACDEISSGGKYRFALRNVWIVLVKFVAPIAIILILLSGFGVFGF